MRRLLTAVIAASLVLAACSEEDPVESEDEPGPTVFTADDNGGTFENASFIRVDIDGMDCIIYKDPVNQGYQSAYAYSGLTCDWGSP